MAKNPIALQNHETCNQRKVYQHFSQKVKETSQRKWGVDHHMSNPDIIGKRIESYINGVTNKIISKLL